ncbi:hypothetical protein [Geodermatophilus sp. SYSU D01105]
MILAAGLLVLIGLGSLVGGLATGVTALYWACVAACALAAVLLVLLRVGTAREAADPDARVLDAPPRSPEPDRWVREEPRTPAHGRPAVRAQDRLPAEEAAVAPPRADLDDDGPSTGAHAAVPRPAADGEPAEEDVEVTDLLLVVDLLDEVLVVDEHPRYHLPGCPHLAGRTAVPLPMTEARADGFTPCATCGPVHHLAQTERSRRSTRGH